MYIYEYEVKVGTNTKPLALDAPVSDTFQIPVTLQDPCDPPTIVEPEPGTIVYTATDDQSASLQLSPEYSVDPSWCPFDLGLKKPGVPSIDNNLSFDKGPQDIILDPILNDIGPSGVDQKTYETCTTITTTNSNGETSEQEVCHDIIVKNPCINPEYVKIELPKPLPGGEYVVESGPLTFPAVALNQQDLVNALPVDHDLCGDIVCVDKY